MTTIDSDSESQDSDDGRRFRFEATRKDATLRLQSQNKKKTSLSSKHSNYRSRSTNSGNHNRRGHKAAKQVRDRWKGSKKGNTRDKHDEIDNRNTKDTAKGSIVKDMKEIIENKTPTENDKRTPESVSSDHRDGKDPARNSLNSKDHKTCKGSRARESKSSSTRASKDTKIREVKDLREARNSRESINRESRDRERGVKRSRDRSHNGLLVARHGHSSREKYRSRERSDIQEKVKPLDTEKLIDDRNKIVAQKQSDGRRADKNMIKRDDKSPSEILDQIGSDSEPDLGALDPDNGPVMSLDAIEDCKELNLSDFDIISDTEGSLSNSPESKLPHKGPFVKGEIVTPHYHGPKIRKRVSRRQYERLLRTQAAYNKRDLEDLCKVNPRNNDDAATLARTLLPNNPTAISDYLLGPDASVSAIEERHGSHKIEEGICSNYADLESDASGCSKNATKSKERDAQEANKFKHLSIDKISLANLGDMKQLGLHKSISKYENERDLNKSEEALKKKMYGPTLPPKYRMNHVFAGGAEAREVVLSPKAKHNHFFDEMSPTLIEKAISARSERNINESSVSVVGLSLPPGTSCELELLELKSDEPFRACGPCLLPSYENMSNQEKKIDTQQESSKTIGPRLPPHLQQRDITVVTAKVQDSISHKNFVMSKQSIFGPTLPPSLMAKLKDDDVKKLDSDSEDDVFGPIPANYSAAMDDYFQQQLEERAKRMKNKLDAGNSVIDKREKWMLELPLVQAPNLGLAKRQFRNRAGPDMSDQSSWTDNPADKTRKREEELSGKTKVADLAMESEKLAISQRDKEMERVVKKHTSKKRNESLLEIHKKKISKKKKKMAREANKASKPARRPFDRDVDLQVNRFDEAQKKSILNKAQLLNDRFSRGESKYL